MDKIRDQEIYARQNANISTKTMKGEKNEENKDFEHYIIKIPIQITKTLKMDFVLT